MDEIEKLLDRYNKPYESSIQMEDRYVNRIAAIKAIQDYGKLMYNEAINHASDSIIKMNASVYSFDAQQSILKLKI